VTGPFVSPLRAWLESCRGPHLTHQPEDTTMGTARNIDELNNVVDALLDRISKSDATLERIQRTIVEIEQRLDAQTKARAALEMRINAVHPRPLDPAQWTQEQIAEFTAAAATMKPAPLTRILPSGATADVYRAMRRDLPTDQTRIVALASYDDVRSKPFAELPSPNTIRHLPSGDHALLISHGDELELIGIVPGNQTLTEHAMRTAVQRWFGR
jgi:hypothetical protein